MNNIVCRVTIGMELVTDPSIVVLVRARRQGGGVHVYRRRRRRMLHVPLISFPPFNLPHTPRLPPSLTLSPTPQQDEPTSGLDSYTADSLMASLRGVAAAGRVVVASLHQPSRDIFAGLDQVVLMGQGRMLYMGPPSEGASVFWPALRVEIVSFKTHINSCCSPACSALHSYAALQPRNGLRSTACRARRLCPSRSTCCASPQSPPPSASCWVNTGFPSSS